jgi:hypothetical protein
MRRDADDVRLAHLEDASRPMPSVTWDPVGGRPINPDPVASAALSSASSECPICRGNRPHPHVREEVEQWATNQVARWGYEATLARLGTAKAIEVHECVACGHERTGDLREIARLGGNVMRWICDECEERRQRPAASTPSSGEAARVAEALALRDAARGVVDVIANMPMTKTPEPLYQAYRALVAALAATPSSGKAGGSDGR